MGAGLWRRLRGLSAESHLSVLDDRDEQFAYGLRVNEPVRNRTVERDGQPERRVEITLVDRLAKPIDVGDFIDHQLRPALCGARNDYPKGGRTEDARNRAA